MARIPEETIERIRDAADILDVVSDYVQLKRRGRNWFGLCPFHQEKTPSFSVNQQKQIYHCFGCGRGGGAFNFVMEVDKLDFLEAVQRLGEKVGIPVELSGPIDPRRKATVQQILDLCELAAAVYRKNLQGDAGAKVRAYLEDRGITPAAQALFKIGYALPGWNNLLKAIGVKKFSREALDQSGLFASGQRGTYDRFRSRIMFPISIPTGRVVALAGRVFDTDDTAKYINSPETPVYHKSEVLYGLSLTRNPIRDQETAIIVEGYLDLIQLHQAGIQNVVAVSGTALTDRHARELRKLTTRIFDTYDLDELRRLLELARESGFSEEQVRNITVEDEEGNTINAFKVIEDIERCRREEKARLEEIQNRKYLTPQDVFKELDGGQKKDLKDLRDKLFPR